jgi:foldase protein PrsA
MLAQAYVSQLNNSVNPSAQEIKTYYDQHAPQFQEAKLSAIIVNFSPVGTPAAGAAAGSSRTEAQAKTKADELVKKIRAGANFPEVAKTDSDHKASADKGGQLGSYSPDKLPKEISDPVFKLKVGEITEPIREASGFYILKLDTFEKKTYEQAQGDIVAQLKSDQVRKVLEQYQVQVQDSDFFNTGAASSGYTPPSLNRPSPGQPKTTGSK